VRPLKPVRVINGKKSCSRCNQLLPVSEFHKHTQTSSGLASACKACTAEVFKATYVPRPRDTAIRVVDGAKPCSRCRQVLPVSRFGRYAGTPTGLAYQCKKCAAEVQRARRNRNKALDPEGYLATTREAQRTWRESASPELRKARGRKGLLKSKGVTEEWYANQLEAQGGVCAICKRPEAKLSSGGGTKMLAVDHDHTTGLARGLLCQPCNIGLGALQDRPDLLRAAASYLIDRPWTKNG
jgi:hypothetical protein